MQYRRLGKSNLRVSALCLGTMMFGDQTDAAESQRIVDHARHQGMNFIDTADVYSLGKSEEITGNTIRAERDHWVLATKVGNKMMPDGPFPNHERYSRKWLMQECDASLKRLGTDYIDIYYLHRDFEEDALDEAVAALGDLIRAGKIRYFGVSNFRAWRIAEIVAECKRQGVPLPAICQPYYNLLNRLPEVEILPACGFHGLGVSPYSPIARGVLTGKYKPGDAPPEGSRAARADKRFMQSEWRPESLVIAQKLEVHAKAKGFSLLQFATAWVLANRFVSSVIAGPKSLAQFEPYFGALDYPWGADDEAIVDSLVPKGHPSTPGYHDPAYPFIGR
ncbi:MAG TPA: aldo/keto reductase, partial [Casimicrobium sp.]|jgi:aryl-alcohol dehydrogenase-like predicted oxidoreductase|nr:aldo/keto reductase [Casimicrobium sp.]